MPQAWLAIAPDLHVGGGADLWGAFIRNLPAADAAGQQARDQPRHADGTLEQPASILRKVRLVKIETA